jgi:protein phosphatase 4 regulatory subunit 3
VETYREKIEKLSYMDTFKHMLNKYEQLTAPVDELSFTTVETEQTPNRPVLTNGQRWQQLKDLDAEEEAYFNAEENDDEVLSPTPAKPVVNGASPLKPVVDYPEDDEEDIELPIQEPPTVNGDHESEESQANSQQTSRDETPPPPERITEKRRRTDDDEDELGKLTQPKRRTSFGSNASNASTTSDVPSTTGTTHILRRKRRLSINKEASQKKITIALAAKKENKAESRDG